MLEVQSLTGGYGDDLVVKNLDFSVKKGSFFGILGPNGCGKSTLLKLITGVLKKESGNVSIDKKPLEEYDRKSLARKITLLPQQPEISFSYSVEDVISMGRYPHKKGLFHFYDEEDERKVHQVIKLLDLEGYAHSPLPSLSGGEQQRVFLARALVQEPSILLLDEPTNHLDVSYQIELMNRIKELAKNENITIISVLHDLNMASLFCDELLLMDEGEIVSLDEPNQVLEETKLSKVYDTPLMRKGHPTVAKPLITFHPAVHKMAAEKKRTFQHSNTDQKWSVFSSEYLKTLSTSEDEQGITWKKTFEFFKNGSSVTHPVPESHIIFCIKGDSGVLFHHENVEMVVFKDNNNKQSTFAIFIDEFVEDGLFFQLIANIGMWMGANGLENNRGEAPSIIIAATQRHSTTRNFNRNNLFFSIKELITNSFSVETNKEV